MKTKFILLILLAFAIGVQAQVTKQQAISLVETSVVGNRIDSVNVFMDSTLKTNAYYVLSPYDSIAVPYSSYWAFFIDEMPEYLWGHDCKYVFVNQANSATTVTNATMPPLYYLRTMQHVSCPLLPTNQPATPIVTGLGTPLISNKDVNDKKYAVLFCGCELNGSSFTSMWNALSHTYCSLIEHGYIKENIYVLSCDGQVTPNTNISLDLDNDGYDDILPEPCSKDNLSDIFRDLSKKIDESCVLYVFTTGHGEKPDTGNIHHYYHLWYGEHLYDNDFANMLEPISCSQMIINLHACYIGGFADDILSMNNNSKKTVLTAVDGDHIAVRLAYLSSPLGFDVYPYLTTTALRNHHVDSAHPWIPLYQVGSGLNHKFDSIFRNYAKYEYEHDYDSLVNGGNANNQYEINELVNFTRTYSKDFRNYGIVHYDCGFGTGTHKDDLLGLHGVHGDVTYSKTVSGPFHIEEELNVTNSATLTMDEGTTFYLFSADIVVDNNATLHMLEDSRIVAKHGDCRVIINGNLLVEDDVEFVAEDGATLEVIINNDINDVENAVFRNSIVRVKATGNTFRHCEFIGSQVDARVASTINNAAIVLDGNSFCPFENNLPYAVRIENFANYSVTSNTIHRNNVQGCYTNGIQIHNSGNGITTENRGQSQVTGNTISNCTGTGLMVYASRGNITMNQIADNGYGVKLFNSSTIQSFSGDCQATQPSQTQSISNNRNFELYMTRHCIPQQTRFNFINDSGSHAFVYYDYRTVYVGDDYVQIEEDDNPANRSSIDFTYNNWGTNFNSATHLVSNGNGITFTTSPIWNFGDCGNGRNPADRMLAQADSLAACEEFQMARGLYQEVVAQYPITTAAETAMKDLLALEKVSGNDFQSLKQYYRTNATITSDIVLASLADNLANKCDEELGNYSEAIAWYENVITDENTSYNDSIFAVIDLGNLYLRMEEEGQKAVGTMMQFIPKSSESHKMFSDISLQQIPQSESLYGTSSLDPVTDLKVDLDNEDILLTWDYPISEMPQRENFSYYHTLIEAFGSSAGDCWTDAANRYEQEDLVDYVGWRVNELKIRPAPYGQGQTLMHHHYIRIWENTPGFPIDSAKVIYEQKVMNPVYDWMRIPVLADIRIKENTEYMFGCHQEPSTPEHAHLAWASDYGPGVEWKGCLLYNHNENVPEENGWITDGYWNFCMETILEDPQGITERLDGYNIRANGELIRTINDPFTRYYTDVIDNDANTTEYCVTAIYEEGESEAECVSIEITAVDEMEDFVSAFEVYPNPSDGVVTIRMNEDEMFSYTLLNAQGQTILTRNAAHGTEQLNLSQFAKGVYFLQLNTKDGTETRKVVIK